MANVGLMGMEVLQVAVQLAEEMHALGLTGSMRDQLTRATESVVLNISEAHPARGADRLRRLQIAANEASECKGGLLLLRIRKQISRETFDRLFELVDRVCAIFYRLCHPR